MSKGCQKIIKVTVLVALVCAWVGSANVFAAEKTAFVVLGTLFDKYEKTQKADAALSEIAGAKQTERDAMVENIRRMKDEMVVLSEGADERVKKQGDIDDAIKSLQAFDEETRKNLKEIRDQNVKEIFDDLTAAIEAYGEKNKYDFIYTDRALIYKNPKLDITEAVLTDLNKNYKS
jgi:Skp family chaperone for outer membrane proteins